MSSDWENYCLNDAGRIVTGKTPKTGVPEYEGYDLPFVTPPDFVGAKWVSKTVRTISTAAAQSVKTSLIPPRSVLVTCIGSDMGKAAIAGSACVTNQQINAVVVDESKFCPEFLYYNLSLRKNEIRGSAGGSAQPILNKTAFGQISFDAPSLSEQRITSQIVSPLDDRITLLRETNQTLKAIAQAIFKSWFVDFDPVKAKMDGRQPVGMDEETAALFPDELVESELGLIPKGWEMQPLSILARFQNGYAFKSSDWAPSGHPVVKIGNVRPSLIDFEGCSFVSEESTSSLDRFRLCRGDLLVGMTGYVGEVGLVREISPPAYLNQRVGKISTQAGISDLGYVFCVTRGAAFKVFAESNAQGSAQANVSGATLMGYRITKPTQSILDKFNGLMTPILESIIGNAEKSDVLCGLRDTLLPRLISGKLRVPVDETEAVTNEE